MRVLGLHTAGHDAGACLFDRGRLVYSIEAERITRQKHDHRCSGALALLLEETAIKPEEIDLVAIGLNSRQELVKLEDERRLLLDVRPDRLHVEGRCGVLGMPRPCLVVAHEACHAALGCHYGGYVSPSLVLTNEGRGNFGRNSLFWYEDGGLTLLESEALPWYGTGFGWTALGYALGFGLHPSVAGTVMGMGGYGLQSEELLAAFLRLPPGLAQMNRKEQGEVMSGFLSSVRGSDSFERRASLVAVLQNLFTESVCDYLRRKIDERRGAGQIVMSGGCALNVVCNSAVRSALPIDLAVPPAPNDAGIALGAAVYAQRFFSGAVPEAFSVYSNGSADTETEAAAALESRGLRPRPVDLEAVAAALATGQVVGWMAGRAEIGPRALGHRSLLGHAAMPGLRRRLSEEIKKREWFRPLAPIMRRERFDELFPGQAASPYMLYAYEARHAGLPEAVHVDGTARIQTLDRVDQPDLHRLLELFEKQTGAPGLINTSLNCRGRPIAQTTRHCLEDFPNGEVDLLVVGGIMAESSPVT